MKSLMGVIDKLDIRRAQVQVEAIIVEVDVNKSSNLGVQWLLFGQGNSTVPAGIINLPGTGTSIVDLAAAALGFTQGTSTTTTTGVPGVVGTPSHQQLDRRYGRHSGGRPGGQQRRELCRADSGAAQRRQQQHHLDALVDHDEQ